MSSAPSVASETAKTTPTSEDQSALERCLAPVDPTAFTELGPAKARVFKAEPGTCEDESVDCRFRKFRTHYEERRFDLAARGFRALALEGDPTELKLHAGELALDSLNILGTYAEPARPSCYEVLGNDNDQLIHRYCLEPTPPREYQEPCIMFFRIAQDVRRSQAETVVAAADRGLPHESAPLYESAGDVYQSVFDEACLPRPKADWRSKFPVVARCDELLFNAYAAFRGAGAHEKRDAAHRTFFDPRLGLTKSSLAKRLPDPTEPAVRVNGPAQ